jgi:hypothetical protein
MKVRDLSFIAIVVFVVIGTQALTRVNRPPAMPEDLSHQGTSRNVRAQCLLCHQSGTMLALERRARHPAKWRDARFDCLLCHLSSNRIEPNVQPATRTTMPFVLRNALGSVQFIFMKFMKEEICD